MKILSNKKYKTLIHILKKQHDILMKQDKLITKLTKENERLNKDVNVLIIENGILNNSMGDIDFPNSSNRSTDLYDPEDIF